MALSFNVVAQRLDLPFSSLSRWVWQARIDSGQRGPRNSGLLNSEVRDELNRLIDQLADQHSVAWLCRQRQEAPGCQATSGIGPLATPGGLDRPGLPLAVVRGLERQPQAGATPLARGGSFETPATQTEYPHHAHALQEWCTGSVSSTAYIEPGSPWENPFVGSFNGRSREPGCWRAVPNRVQSLQTAFGALGGTSLEVLQQWKAA